MKFHSTCISAILFSLLLFSVIRSQDYKLLESDDNHLVLEFNFSNQFVISDLLLDGIKFTTIKDENFANRKPGEPFLPNRIIEFGLPQNKIAKITVIENEREMFYDKFVISTPDSIDQPFDELTFNQDIYGTNSLFPSDQALVNSEAIFRYIKIASLSISPFQFNPVQRLLIFNKKLIVRVDFALDNYFTDFLSPISDKTTEEIVKSSLINSKVALNFLGKRQSILNSPQENYWYDPNKNYYKIYLNNKGIYRITYDYLLNAGILPDDLQNMKLEIINNGLNVPIDIVDTNGDGLFNSADYFQFFGEPAKPTDQYTRMNIYNKSNVYWFSYQADTVNLYKYKDGYPVNYSPLITNSFKTLQWEEDINFQHFGHANNDHRDYWHWGYTEAKNGSPYHNFLYWIQDSIWSDFVVEKPQAKIKVGLHGLTALNCSAGNGHNVNIKFNTKTIGTKNWNGQESALYEGDFYLSFNTFGGGDTAQLVWQDAQKFEVESNGNICNPELNSDLVMINYFELGYWAWNKANSNHFCFRSPPNNYYDNRYYIWLWQGDNMKIYIPSRGEVIANPDIKNDSDKSVYFVDTVGVQTDYYCVASDYYLLPDSIQYETSSNLRNISNSADYIIISHPLFIDASQRLAEYRSSNLKGYSSPRIKVVNVYDIYDEFSYGLLNPFAIKDFIKYAFDNWQSPAPSYIVLMGDLNSDYRNILVSSKKNFIPSLPFHLATYGQAASDNNFVSFVGEDFVPEIALGRISCETIEEANLLVDKIINYPLDNGKEWKENILLLSSGLSAADENNLKFNDKNMILANAFVEPRGFRTTKVFRYPNKPEYIQYQGEGPDIRREIDNGAVLVNYYGHGGGYQWDLVFTDDDILALNNGGRQPFVISITCYTAHIDNQEVFGEIFNSIQNKGSIAFLGSSGVTYWPTTAFFNQDLFKEIFTNKKYVIGDAILKAKSKPGYGTMLAVLTLLGDPALELTLPYYPDFVLKSSSISIEPFNPLINDTVLVKVNLENLGTSFLGDSVRIDLFEDSVEDSSLIGTIKIDSFPDEDSVYFNWIPTIEGERNLIAIINNDHSIEEIDFTDNITSQSYSVFSFDKPKILKPTPNFFTGYNTVDFVLLDIGHYVSQNFTYQIIIDTARNLGSSFKNLSPVLSAERGIVKWTTVQLQPGEYFYKVFIYSNSDTNSSNLGTFSITSYPGKGYLAKATQLLDFDISNINYSEENKNLILNTAPLPPKPSKERLLDSLYILVPEDSTEITSCTTDGTYLYFGHLSYYRNGARSKIYKVGTGLNGTIKGMNYGTIGNLDIEIKNGMCYHSDGFIYVATGDDSTLLKVNISTGDTIRVNIPGRLIPAEDGLLKNSGFYIASDSVYIYNLSPGFGQFKNKHVLRTFDPANNWSKVGDDILFLGSSEFGFSGFFVASNNVFTYESYQSGYMRRFRLSDGFFEEEFIVNYGSIDIYTWAYDWKNDFVYAGLFRPDNFHYNFGFQKFMGTYKEASGSIVSNLIGPARKWNNLSFELDTTGSLGYFSNYLLGKNYFTHTWDTLESNIPSGFDLSSLDQIRYPFLKMKFDFVDSSLGVSEPLKFKSLQLNYDYFPELNLYPNEIIFDADTLLHGLPIQMTYKIENIGYTTADSVKLDFYNNISDTTFFSEIVTVPADSFITVSKSISTDNLLYSAPISPIDIEVIATSPIKEYFDFNNSSNGSFNVSRDSIKPNFNITFDGKELVDGDVISSKPEIIMTLTDNSPLPLSASCFEISHTVNDHPQTLNIPTDIDSFIITPYPNSSAQIIWRPELEDGEHKLSIYTKDASLNPYSSTSLNYRFNVYNNPDLLQVYNYPNPFKDKTDFTFELRGIIPPEELKIKVFSVAGRLIKELIVPGSTLQIGFNQIPWDGKDQDGDEIANGVYFYKIISKHGDETRVTTQKLAKLK